MRAAIQRPKTSQAQSAYCISTSHFTFRLYYYLTSLIQGNFGNSLLTHQPVLKSILEVLPNTLTLISVSMILAFIIGIPMGVLSAVRMKRLV